MRRVHGDAIYASWMSGCDPDDVDFDRIDDDAEQGYSPDECVDREVDRLIVDERPERDEWNQP